MSPDGHSLSSPLPLRSTREGEVPGSAPHFPTECHPCPRCVSSVYCELLPPPRHGLGSVSDDTALGLPTLPPVVRASETLILNSHSGGENSVLSLKTPEKEAKGSWTAPSGKTGPVVAALLALPTMVWGEGGAMQNGELKWNTPNTEPGPQAWRPSLEQAMPCSLTMSTASSLPSFLRFHICPTWGGWMKAGLSPSLASVCWHCVYIAASGRKVALLHHGYL